MSLSDAIAAFQIFAAETVDLETVLLVLLVILVLLAIIYLIRRA